MAVFAKAVRLFKTPNNLSKLLTNLSLSFNNHGPSVSAPACRIQCMVNTAASFHTSIKRPGLMEFFDEENNWGENEIKTGRSWRKDELRLKSNEDLHKLWYVLLKERNMLMTMEEHYKKIWEIFPNPERIDKVQVSMDNLELVVRERNRAYHLLETGENGERPKKLVYNQIGLKRMHRMCQYHIPQFMNKKWKENHIFSFGGHAVSKFRRYYNEIKWNKKRRQLNREKRHAAILLGKFPNLDLEALKQKFPSVNVNALKNHKRSRGHYVP